MAQKKTNKSIKTVSILGSSYRIYMNVPISEDKDLNDKFGYCSPTMQKIVIADLDSIESWKEEPSYSKKVQNNRTLRHEIIHAFLNESGLWGSSFSCDTWALNEEMIDWLAIQFPKIVKVFKKLGCEDEI